MKLYTIMMGWIHDEELFFNLGAATCGLTGHLKSPFILLSEAEKQTNLEVYIRNINSPICLFLWVVKGGHLVHDVAHNLLDTVHVAGGTVQRGQHP